jgi:hypothetical protein
MAGFLLFASTLPGYRDPDEDLRRCKKRIERIATAMILWARSHDGEFADSLQALQREGLLADEPGLFTCPITRTPYTIQKGIRADMPGSAVLVACPEGAMHRFVFHGKERQVSLFRHFIGVDGLLHYESEREQVPAERSVEAIREKFRKRIKDQREVLALVEGLRGGDKAAAEGIRTFARDMSRHNSSRALAVWGMGASGQKAFLRDLRPFLPTLQGLREEFTLTVAQSLLRLGEERSVPFLIETLNHPKPSFRRAARDTLEEAFREATPPMPNFKPYAPSSIREKDLQAWRNWWAGRGK